MIHCDCERIVHVEGDFCCLIDSSMWFFLKKYLMGTSVFRIKRKKKLLFMKIIVEKCRQYTMMRKPFSVQMSPHKTKIKHCRLSGNQNIYSWIKCNETRKNREREKKDDIICLVLEFGCHQQETELPHKIYCHVFMGWFHSVKYRKLYAE